jgi:hypothetical protein
VFKRLFWLLMGFTWGLATSWYIVRSVKRTVRRTVETYTPAQLASRAGEGYRGARRNVRAAWAEGRVAMRDREAELWSRIETSRNRVVVAEVVGAPATTETPATPAPGQATAPSAAPAVTDAGAVRDELEAPVPDELEARRRRPVATPAGTAGTRR